MNNLEIGRESRIGILPAEGLECVIASFSLEFLFCTFRLSHGTDIFAFSIALDGLLFACKFHHCPPHD